LTCGQQDRTVRRRVSGIVSRVAWKLGCTLTALQVAGTEALQVPHTLLLEVAVVFVLLLEVEVAVVVGLFVVVSLLVVLIVLETVEVFDVSLAEYAALIEELMVEVAEVVEFDDGVVVIVVPQKLCWSGTRGGL
jgi:hypothetical protein